MDAALSNTLEDPGWGEGEEINHKDSNLLKVTQFPV
jgi:hypothetical protein